MFGGRSEYPVSKTMGSHYARQFLVARNRNRIYNVQQANMLDESQRRGHSKCGHST